MSRKMTGVVRAFDRKSGKGFVIPSDGRKEVQVHISAFTLRDTEVFTPGLRAEFCRVNGLRGPTTANVYLSQYDAACLKLIGFVGIAQQSTSYIITLVTFPQGN